MMKKLVEAAFRPPGKTKAGEGEASRFAILPQSTDDELSWSEVHSKLDRALNFLQRDVGYALLDDAQPCAGGAVRLRQVLLDPGAAVPKGERSARLPKDYPVEHTSPQAGISAEELEGEVLKLLQHTFERSGGRLSAAALAELVRGHRLNGHLGRVFQGMHGDRNRDITWEEFRSFYANAHAGRPSVVSPGGSTASSSSPHALQTVLFVLEYSSDWKDRLRAELARRGASPKTLAVTDQLGVAVDPFGGSPPARAQFPLSFKDASERARAQAQQRSRQSNDEILVIHPDLQRYAYHGESDLVLVSRFVRSLYETLLEDMVRLERFDSDSMMSPVSSRSSSVSIDSCSSKAMALHEEVVTNGALHEMVLKSMRLMHLCSYDYADVVLVLAYALIYFRYTFTKIGKKMTPNELAHVVALHIYLAHAFILDETCPLREWWKLIFRKYCKLKILDQALFQLFKMRPAYRMRITDDEERLALLGLSGLRASQKMTPTGSEASGRHSPSASISQAAGAYASNGKAGLELDAHKYNNHTESVGRPTDHARPRQSVRVAL